MKSILIVLIGFAIGGCSTGYLNRHQMKVVHGLFYYDNWPSGKVIAKAVEINYEDQSYSKLNEFVRDLYGKCAKDVPGTAVSCEFELQCIGHYRILADNTEGVVKNVKVQYSDIICD